MARLIMLTRKNDSPLEFDLAKAIEQSCGNSVFSMQYAHARALSVLRHAQTETPDIDTAPAAIATAPVDPAEMNFVKLLAGWPRLVESAAEAHEPTVSSFICTMSLLHFVVCGTRSRTTPACDS